MLTAPLNSGKYHLIEVLAITNLYIMNEAPVFELECMCSTSS